MKPCPFCGGPENQVHRKVLLRPWYVECDECGATGPESMTAQGAIEAWDLRCPAEVKA